MKNLLSFILLHLGAMITSFVIGAYLNSFTVMMWYWKALNRQMHNESDTFDKIILLFPRSEEVLQISILVGFSYLILSLVKPKLIPVFEWGSAVVVGIIFLFIANPAVKAAIVALSKTYPRLDWEMPAMVRVGIFTFCLVGTSIGYHFAIKYKKI